MGRHQAGRLHRQREDLTPNPFGPDRRQRISAAASDQRARQSEAGRARRRDCRARRRGPSVFPVTAEPGTGQETPAVRRIRHRLCRRPAALQSRSEEHTSELQSLTNLVCRLLLEKKKKNKKKTN